MADHWNFLANLLGAPGAAEPPPKQDEEQETQAAIDASPAATDNPAMTDNDEGKADAPSAVAAVNQADQSDKGLLDALKEVVPEPAVPGFVTGAGDDDSAGSSEERAGRAEYDTLDSAWGALASELGVDPDSPPPPRSAAASSTGGAKIERQPRQTKTTPPKRTSSGFGSGLGIDLGPEPEEPLEQPTAEAAGNEYELLDDGPRLEGNERGRRREPQEDRFSRPDRPRAGSRELRQGRSDDPSDRDRGSDQDEELERPRRRGRRGVRQRLSEEDIDRGARDEQRPLNRDDSDSPATSRADRIEGAAGDKSSPRRSQRDLFDDDLDDDLDDEVDEFGAGVVSGPDQSASEDDDAPRSRSRRRGRRGRGRGPRGDDGRRSDGVGRDTPAESVDERPPREDRSEFDDDHEDDAEVEVIRRGQRRGRSQPEEGRGRDERGPRRGRPNRGEADRPEDLDAPPRRHRGREDSQEAEPKRRSVPTWLETVEILVNANIENHKKSPRPSRGRGGKRR